MKNRILVTSLNILKYISIYYLSAKMICFAIPKFLFMQFRISNWESYIPLAEISKTQHMWSFFGRSYNYNIFIGSIEFLIGTLIVFKKTRLIALLIALGTFTNILILNYEYEVGFALNHILLDLLLTLFLLSYYYKDLYQFFVQNGGRFNNLKQTEKNKFLYFFPLLYVVGLSVSYFIFSNHVKTKFSVRSNFVGAYEITKVEINDSILEIKKGILAKDPMMFLEYNNQFVLSIDDTLYKGRFALNKEKITIYLNNQTKFNMKSLNGIIDQNNIEGRIDNQRNLKIFYKRINGKKNYINELYR